MGRASWWAYSIRRIGIYKREGTVIIESDFYR
jgi:hypothetical protein